MRAGSGGGRGRPAHPDLHAGTRRQDADVLGQAGDHGQPEPGGDGRPAVVPDGLVADAVLARAVMASSVMASSVMASSVMASSVMASSVMDAVLGGRDGRARGRRVIAHR